MGIRRKLQEVLRDLAPLEKQGRVEGFFNNTENAAQLGGLVEGIRDAMIEYQVCALSIRSFTPATSNIFARLRYSKGFTINNKVYPPSNKILTTKLAYSW